jgi:DNA primase
MDYDAIRQSYDLQAEVERDLGQPVKSNGGWSFWRCPFHSDSDPSFGVRDDKFYCYGCQKRGDVVDWLTDFRGLRLDTIAADLRLDDTETRLRRLEYQQRDHARRLAEHEKRLTALERIHNCTDHLRYHNAMPPEALDYWYTAGMWPDTIERYRLGYCPRCPTDSERRPSYTIPVISNGKLWNIRHRLAHAANGDKYRPHIAGLPNVLFNADTLRTPAPDVLIVEGEKKSIIADQEGLRNVGVMGKAGFNKAWAAKFERFRVVNVCYDPDGTDRAAEVAALFGERGRVVVLPEKLDDLLVEYGATREDIQAFIDLARRV